VLPQSCRLCFSPWVVLGLRLAVSTVPSSSPPVLSPLRLGQQQQQQQGTGKYPHQQQLQ
jgi:hypothetical protein